MGAVLEARGIRKSFGPVRALRGADLAIGEGELVALFGSNGAGKSTLVRCLASLMRPDSGEVLVGGRPINGPGAGKLRSRIGLVTHQTLLYDSLTAEENLLFYASLYGLRSPGARVRALLGEFGLRARAGDPVRGFSRGMQQRMSLARALLHDPDILLLDEPATGLDPSAAFMLRSRLEGFRSEGRAALLVSHDIAWALSVADRYAVLDGGRIVAVGSPTETDATRIREEHFPVPAGAAR